MEPPVSLHFHRLHHDASKLPTFRSSDVKTLTYASEDAVPFEGDSLPATLKKNTTFLSPNPPTTTTATTTAPAREKEISAKKREHMRNHSESGPTISTPPSVQQQRPATSPGGLLLAIENNSSSSTSQPSKKARVPASRSSNYVYLGKGPPPAMLTQKSSLQAFEIENSTETWLASLASPVDDEKALPAEPNESKPPITPLIPPIRGFRTSRKSSVEMNATSPRAPPMDQDDTLRALEGYNTQRLSRREQEEQSSDDSDLFLKLAREEAAGNSRGPIRRSQLNRQSLPPNHTVFQTSISRRRGSDLESSPEARSREDPMSQALTYRPSGRERAPTALDMSRNRYYGATSHSTPTTPRALGSREISPELQASFGGRRPCVPDQVLPSRTASYRQSNLSYSAPRTYNSSPLVSRTVDINDNSETQRTAEGTESTVSTTAPSTVWDELEDLKSRIHRLELTGKLPATSGAAISRASNDRPPTATTTATTISSSPKRGRGNSISPIDPNTTDATSNDAHPLLNSALTKSKTLLSPEVFRALEATATDALAIASMAGGQPGLSSSSQSTVGGGANLISDRQVRRKADSMCRSLTELCLALSEGRSEQAQPKQNSIRPKSRDAETENSDDNTSLLPSPRYAPSEAGTPTQSSMAGRRTSLLLRNRRGGTEEPEDEDDSRFRAPSRASTEIGRIRNSPREYVSQQPLPDNRIPAVQSSLPVRRHYPSTSLTNTGASALPAISNIGGRRYLDRSTPERDTTGFVGRLAEERGQRKLSIGQGFPLGRTGSLTRRTRQPSSMDATNTGHKGVYQ